MRRRAMIDLATPGGSPIGTPMDKNPRSPRPGDALDPAGRQSAGEYASLFKSFFDSFRRQLLECYGKRCDEMIKRAEEKVSGNSPGFSLRAIGPENATSVLDLVETM